MTHHTGSDEERVSVVHQVPPRGSGIMPCCGRTPLEVSLQERMTLEPGRVTCNVPHPADDPSEGDDRG